MQAYRAVLGLPDVRRVVLLGLVIRIPMWAGAVVLTLHVVTHLGGSYGAAGLVVAVETVALSASAPWRGRRLDRVGLRAAVAPSVVVLTACWSVAPFVPYWPLFVLVGIAGLFTVPTFSIVRQALMHAVPETQRRTALAVDSVAVEISFMIGPALGVLLATYWPTSWALLVCEFASIAGSVALWVANPQLRGANDDAGATPLGVRGWLNAQVLAVLAMSAAATVVLTGTDVAVVAALRDMGHQSWIGWQLTVWGLGSAIGGLVYGAVHRTMPVAVLLGLLAATTAPVALADGPIVLALLLFGTGLFCAPTITAAVDSLSHLVPERVRGEALGWHGGAMTAGGALGAPLAGTAIDRVGWHGGFVLPALVSLLAAVAGGVALRGRSADPEAELPAAEQAVQS
jgi:MFS family permease